MRPHRGGLILALGILSLVGCGIFTGLPAWLMGNGDMRAMDSGAMDPEGRSLTQAGKICGMITTILSLLAIVVFVILMALGVLAGVANSQG